MFGQKQGIDSEEFARLEAQLTKLHEEIAKLTGERSGHRQARSLEDEIRGLKEQKSALEIDKAKLVEQNERERREVEHLVGLERRRQEFEADAAKRDAVLEVREENLSADKSRFEGEMKFTRERFTAEVGYLKELMTEILDRLPTVTVDKTVEPIRRRKAVDE